MRLGRRERSETETMSDMPEILKREIAHIEGILNGDPYCGTRAVLFQIPIDYGASRTAV